MKFSLDRRDSEPLSIGASLVIYFIFNASKNIYINLFYL